MLQPGKPGQDRPLDIPGGATVLPGEGGPEKHLVPA